ncbi:hypothetical protein JCM19301_1930 [Jejuia pallidilutea]|uniref:Uncharacterized protein n=2 Tax=Jejuia pallidilutea TaxID=504487 RepID=A0A090W4Y1_9FLAO|nr:hypothetical protein [Jejuia pallidilutea]GAL68532.1 hypothetical protein JCM19301_1930 [Jejuia pallidilutea]GAL72075.1 hypothetical protein JCM19302_2202 [Jejuia pallidilutea]GAL88412.1 hypothetical protein JCM19538_2925 [Jejuia pallidilutea]
MEKTISYGNYDRAINDAIGKLKINKDRKGKADIIMLLEEAYYKANARDLENINFLKKDNNPESYLRIFDAYVSLDNRQEAIKPLLPLYVKGKEVNFNFNDYSDELITYRNSASLQLYNNAQALLNSNNKFDVRAAYNQLRDIEDMNPNYKDTRELMAVAHQRGTDFVLVDMINDSGKIIPERLENDLLNFSSYGINNFWLQFHSVPDDKVTYNFNMKVNLRDINISPEQIKERQIIKEKQISDGKMDLIENGKVVKDSLGNAIKIDRMKTVRCEYYEFTQFKASQITGNVEYYNLSNNQLVDTFPITSEFVFEHIYATSRGDRRALETNLVPFLERRAIPFPTEEQMIFDTGEDLKMQLKQIINSYSTAVAGI